MKALVYVLSLSLAFVLGVEGACHCPYIQKVFCVDCNKCECDKSNCCKKDSNCCKDECKCKKCKCCKGCCGSETGCTGEVVPEMPKAR